MNKTHTIQNPLALTTCIASCIASSINTELHIKVNYIDNIIMIQNPLTLSTCIAPSINTELHIKVNYIDSIIMAHALTSWTDSLKSR